jgi:DNA-binding transcriptional MerR regulator
MATYRIDDLAQAASTTVRNVRHYQDRALLPPPRREGRIGLYDDSHLARLRLIGQLQERGYTLATIADLLSAWENGRNLADLLGLEKALTDPWTQEHPTYLTPAELLDLFSTGMTPEEAPAVLARAEEFGFVQTEGDRFRIPSPQLLHVGAELVAAGVPMDAVLEITVLIRDDCDSIADRFVNLAIEHGGLEALDRAAPDEIPAKAAFIQRLRPLAQLAVEGLLAQAMQTHIQTRMSAQLEAIAQHDPTANAS